MVIKQKIALKLAQRLALTPKMRQALHILQLPLLELKRYLRERITENPLLEEPEDDQTKDEASTEELLNKLMQNEKDAPEYFDSDNDNTSYSQEALKKHTYKQSLASYPPSLQEHLLRQLHFCGCSPLSYKIGQFIIGNIDENGYLHSTIEEIQDILKENKIDIRRTLKLIQSFDPPGIGAENLKECLLIQLNQKGQKDSLAAEIVHNFLTDLEKKNYEHLARIFKVPIEKIEQAVKEIASLEPKPGRAFSRFTDSYIKPDIILQKQKGKYEILLNDEELPALQINARYKTLWEDKNTKQNVKKYLGEQLKSAVWLIKTVAQRQSTLLKLARFLVKTQKDFLDKGPRYLLPLTEQTIAQAIKRDKSTVSRIIANKYIQTPYGIVPLRDFLSQGIRLKPGKVISVKNIKAQIEDLIRAESQQHPLTDEKITQILKEREINIARRTCAKYREQLKILPANLRRKSLHT